MTGTAFPERSEEPPGPPALVRAIAFDLVTRYRLRLTDDRDSRMGPLAGGYLLGAAAWTGRRAAFVGFYEPPADPATAAADLTDRLRAAERWGGDRLAAQGAERCEVLLIALGPVPRAATPLAGGGGVDVGAVSIDLAAGTAEALTPLPGGLPGVGELRAHARSVRDGRPAPTLAQVDLAEREITAGGYAQPARRVLSTGPVTTYALIGLLVVIWILEKSLESRVAPEASCALASSRFGFGRQLQDLLLPFGALGNCAPYDTQWWRYVSSAFLHDNSSVAHVLFNGLALFFIGRLVEQLYGRLMLLGVFVITGIAGGVAWVLCSVAGLASAGESVGASGGIAGLVGLLIVIGRVQGRDVPVGIAATVRQYAVSVAVINLIFGFTLANVNNFAHIGGFLTGAALGVVMPPRAQVGGRDLRRVEQAVLAGAVALAGLGLAFAGQHLAGTLQPSTTPQL